MAENVLNVEEHLTKVNFESDILKIEKKGITFRMFIAQNTRTPHIIIQMSDSKRNTMSIGMNVELSYVFTKAVQKLFAAL